MHQVLSFIHVSHQGMTDIDFVLRQRINGEEERRWKQIQQGWSELGNE